MHERREIFNVRWQWLRQFVDIAVLLLKPAEFYAGYADMPSVHDILLEDHQKISVHPHVEEEPSAVPDKQIMH